MVTSINKERFQFCLFIPMFLTLLLSACDNGQGPLFENEIMKTRPPLNLRTIPNDVLRAEVIIGDTSKTYSGSQFPDSEWIIDLDVEANRIYPLMVRWFADEHLLMEESGSIFTDENIRSIRPDLDFATRGPDRFDTDCDGLPNLNEINLGLNPGTVSEAPCREAPPISSLNVSELAYLAWQFDTFQNSGMTDRVVQLDQHINVRDSLSDQSQFYSLILLSAAGTRQTDGSESVANKATVQLAYRSTGSDSINFFLDADVVDATPADSSGSSCVPRLESGYSCTTPLDLKKPGQYTVSVSEISPFRWQATVTDESTTETTIAGTIETSTQTRWRSHGIDLGFGVGITPQGCSQGLEKISTRFTAPVVNGRSLDSNGAVNPSNCVAVGIFSTATPWTGGEKLIDGTSWFSLTIGN